MLTTDFVDGAPNWLDIGAPDIDGACSFYGGLFGWRFRSAGPDAGGYGFFQLDGRTVAGGMRTEPGQGPPSWTLYFRSEDARATAQAAQQAHGRVLFGPVDVLGQGHMAVLSDQAGATFGIWQPGETSGVEVANAPGALCWAELHTPDIAAAAAFYRRVLGLETSGVPFPGGTYTCVNPGGAGEDAMFGGMVPLARPEDEPYWLPYFEVEDADAVAAEALRLGGTLVVPPATIERVGRMATLADPYGARFAVIKSAGARE
ncbi:MULTISPECIES: VOC family protein [Streptomyces]|uniref:VOC domain-containing protein n=1 Tax=Streptomyces misionensis TaxID=67331 RepID=A0A1H5EW84_9ACTN|nr:MULTISPECIES: VOC family protein [Streptomyces]SED95319.1 hypothetical protein SAMN04490357_6429 [Streptomyces misionensis]SFY52323.1 27 kDa antigen Cfp30B [Streptomyces sp. F-1]